MSEKKNEEKSDDLVDAFDGNSETNEESPNAEATATEAEAETEPEPETASGGRQKGRKGKTFDTEDFYDAHAKLLAGRMKSLFGDIPDLPQDPDEQLADYKNIVKAAAATLEGAYGGMDEETTEYSANIGNALKRFQSSVKNRNSGEEDNDASSVFGNLNLEDAISDDDDDNNMSFSFMEGLLKSMLTAEIVLPSVETILEKYEKFFAENRKKIPAKDKKRYKKQFELYKVIESQFKNEKPDDTPAMKKKRTETIMDVLRELRAYGRPPQEILESCDSFLLNTVKEVGTPQCPTM